MYCTIASGDDELPLPLEDSDNRQRQPKNGVTKALHQLRIAEAAENWVA